MPTTLLDEVIDAHGGLDRWREISKFRADITVAGAIWSMKTVPGLFNNVVIAGSTTEQYVTISPFGDERHYTTWQPGRQTIQTLDGAIIDDRPNPASVFVGTARATPWDPLQAAYFASEGNWNYFVAPFIFTRDDVRTEETGQWDEEGQTWRRLQVTYPADFVAHCPIQTYYFDDEAMLRRIDYSVEILGGGPAVHYPSEYRVFDGITVPTKRRVYVRNLDGSPRLDSVSISVDVHDIAYE